MNVFTNFKTLAWLLACLLCTGMYAQTPEYVPGEFIIKMKPHKSAINKLFLKNQMQAVTRKVLPGSGIEVWQIPDADVSKNIKQLIGEYHDHPDIEYIEPNYYYTLTGEADDGQNFIPDDTHFGDLWGLHNTGQNGGTPDADINAPEAWEIATGSPSVVVALIDSGVDWKHPDLAENIWQNLGEDADGDGRVLEWNGTTWIFDPDDINDTDDDGNGYPDDFIGWDFINDDNDPFDSSGGSAYGHGTHVAGTIGAVGNNGMGISGVTWDVQIAPLRVFANARESGDVIIEAITYALNMNMPMSNNSYENSLPTQALQNVLQTASNNGHLFVAAAGNFQNDNDTNPNYPVSFPFDNIIGVTAIDHQDNLWIQSPSRGASYGATSVDIGAPGAVVRSTHPFGSYGYLSGTSMATPHVTGACALLLERYPNKSHLKIKDAILNNATTTPTLTGKCTSDGRLNLYEAMSYLETLPSVSCRERDSLALVALYNATNGANWDNTWNLSQPMNTWYGVTLNEYGCVKFLSLSNNGLSGSIPSEIGNLINLQSLRFHDNQLNGNIPIELGNLSNVYFLRLHNNNLSGSIPPELGNLSDLIYFTLHSNQLSGGIPPEFMNLSNLTDITLHSNQLSGCYDANLAGLCLQLVSDFNSSISDGNNFNVSWEDFCNTGIGLCTLSPCRQSDSLALVALYNSTNGANWTNTWDLTQPMHTWTGVVLNGLGCVRVLNLENNGLNGNIPPELGNLSNLINLALPTNQLNGNIPPELGNLSNLEFLNLFNNGLDGGIPPELGNLNNLSFLFLAYNQLNGSIPPELGNLSNLEILFLYGNVLTGSIPPELGNLNKLNYLDLDHNQLSGCHDINLLNLCDISSSSIDGGNNNFDASWQDFCNIGAGTCELVWPGDYNYDGTVNELDPLHWGLAAGFTGPGRPGATTAFQGQQAPDWSQSVEGINSKHQDGNGDGIVDGLDLQVISDNFGSIHTYTQPVYIASGMQYILVEVAPVAGSPSYDLYVYDSIGDDIEAHGLAGVLEFYDTPVAQVIMRTDNSSLTPSDNLTVYDVLENRLHFALTRSDKNNQLCNGPVANFVVATNNIPTGDSLEIAVENGSNIQANGDMLTIAGMTYEGLSPSATASGALMVNTSVIHVQCDVAGSAWVMPIGGIAPYTYQWNTGETTDRITDLTAGIYDVTVTDASGASINATFTVEGQYIPLYDANGNPIDCLYSPCPTLLTPDGAILPGTYQADRTINSDGTLTGNTDYKAGETIILEKGFEIPPETEFSGTIEDCNGN